MEVSAGFPKTSGIVSTGEWAHIETEMIVDATHDTVNHDFGEVFL
jgi:hypothetical protein